jgi:hypothetical protein
MKGIQFVIDESGKKKAVLIDLEEWGELWEDFMTLWWPNPGSTRTALPGRK